MNMNYGMPPVSMMVPSPGGGYGSNIHHHQTSVMISAQQQQQLDNEWKKIESAKKRLEIQQAKLALDMELAKEEKKKSKELTKLKSSRNVMEQHQEVETLQDQLVELQELHEFQMEGLQDQLRLQEEEALELVRAHEKALAFAQDARSIEQSIWEQSKEEYELRLVQLEEEEHLQQQSLPSSSRDQNDDADDDSYYNNSELKQLQRQLQKQKAQRTADEERIRNLQSTLDDMELENQRLHLQSRRKTSVVEGHDRNTTEETNSPTNKPSSFLLTQVQQEKDALMEQVTTLQASMEQVSTLRTKLEHMQAEHAKLQEQHEEMKESASAAASAASMTEKLETTIHQLQERNTNLLTEMADQTTQWSSMQSRNKLLLDQAKSKSVSLQSRVDTLQRELYEQHELVRDIQASKEALIKQQKLQSKMNAPIATAPLSTSSPTTSYHGRTNNRLIPSSAQDERSAVASVMSRLSSPSHILIPSDLASHDGSTSTTTTKTEKKHVIEWNWTGESGLTGIYTGWLDLGANPDGHGTLRLQDGSIYDGEWQNGVREGHGVYTSYEGDLFRGMWKGNTFHGRGVYIWPDGQMYTGDYVEGLRHGKGIETWPHGARYEGDYRGDHRNGKGVYHYPDGRNYIGDYKNDRPHGQGMQASSDGTVLYDGEWNMGEFIPSSVGDFVNG